MGLEERGGGREKSEGVERRREGAGSQYAVKGIGNRFIAYSQQAGR